MTDTDGSPDPAGSFAALMAGAAQAADAQVAEAPYGYTQDPATGEMRPKKSPGRPKRSPSVEELKAPAVPAAGSGDDAAGTGEPSPPSVPVPAADRAPDDARKPPKSGSRAPSAPIPPYRSGVIAAGVNKLYRRAGKIVRAMDADIGEAIIQSARNTADPGEADDSVGAAWDELAKTNPRIRRFLLKAVAGGAWAQLVMAHAPIGMAIVMKPAILNLIPFSRLIESMAEPDEDTPAGDGGLPAGLTADDAQKMAALAQQQMQRMGLSVPPEVAEQMAQAAAAMANGGIQPSAPPGFTRQQPRRPANRAERRKAAA
jgi:hypothetical protein